MLTSAATHHYKAYTSAIITLYHILHQTRTPEPLGCRTPSPHVIGGLLLAPDGVQVVLHALHQRLVEAEAVVVVLGDQRLQDEPTAGHGAVRRLQGYQSPEMDVYLGSYRIDMKNAAFASSAKAIEKKESKYAF